MELSVPFHGAYNRMEGTTWVSARVSGILRFEPTSLVLQVREQRQRISLSETEGRSAAAGDDDDSTTTTVIPLEDVAAVEFRPGYMMAPRIRITVKRLERLDAFRWADGVLLKLSVRLRDRAAARELALVASTALVDRDLARLESEESEQSGRLGP